MKCNKRKEPKKESKTKKSRHKDKPNYDIITGKEDTCVENYTKETKDAEDNTST